MGNRIQKLYFCHTEALLAKAQETAEIRGIVRGRYTICGHHRQDLVKQCFQGTAINRGCVHLHVQSWTKGLDCTKHFVPET